MAFFELVSKFVPEPDVSVLTGIESDHSHSHSGDSKKKDGDKKKKDDSKDDAATKLSKEEAFTKVFFFFFHSTHKREERRELTSITEKATVECRYHDCDRNQSSQLP